jgi:hypothetical protein
MTYSLSLLHDAISAASARENPAHDVLVDFQAEGVRNLLGEAGDPQRSECIAGSPGRIAQV